MGRVELLGGFDWQRHVSAFQPWAFVVHVSPYLTLLSQGYGSCEAVSTKSSLTFWS